MNTYDLIPYVLLLLISSFSRNYVNGEDNVTDVWLTERGEERNLKDHPKPPMAVEMKATVGLTYGNEYKGEGDYEEDEQKCKPDSEPTQPITEHGTAMGKCYVPDSIWSNTCRAVLAVNEHYKSVESKVDRSEVEEAIRKQATPTQNPECSEEEDQGSLIRECKSCTIQLRQNAFGVELTCYDCQIGQRDKTCNYIIKKVRKRQLLIVLLTEEDDEKKEEKVIEESSCQEEKPDCCQSPLPACCKQQDTCGEPKDSCGEPQGACGELKNSCGASKETCCEQRDPCGASKETCCEQRDPCGASKETCCEQRDPCGASKETCCEQRDPCGASKETCCEQRDPCGAPKDICSKPKDTCGEPKESCGQKKTSCEQNDPCNAPQDTCGAPKKTCGAPEEPPTSRCATEEPQQEEEIEEDYDDEDDCRCPTTPRVMQLTP